MTEGIRYLGDGKRRGPAEAPWPTHPELYEPDPRLVQAVNVALLLGKPLLLTGEPGTGKTELATAVAWELGLEQPLRFDTRSTSEAKHLFYTFDALGRFQAAHGGGGAGAADPLLFLEFQALGRAILRSRPRSAWTATPASASATPAGSAAAHPPVSERAVFDRSGDAPGARRGALADATDSPRRSVVLIDEIDKAPRDFPNDLLGAIERMNFSIPELHGAELSADPAFAPVVIATSNSESVLPEAFLRRCVYFHIEFPDTRPGAHGAESKLQRIVRNRSADWVADRLRRKFERKLADAALALFAQLRSARLRKSPATAELIEWVRALHADPDCRNGQIPPEAIRRTIGIVVKRKEDVADALDLLAPGKVPAADGADAP